MYRTEQIAKEQAEAALAAVIRQFKSAVESYGPPTLHEPGFHDTCWTIAWEGPYEWTLSAFHGGVDEELYELALEFGTPEQARETATIAPELCPPGIFPEPKNGWCLCLYPAHDEY